jgi:hypothetical protein
MRRLLVCLFAFAGSLAEAQESIYVGLGFGQFSYEEEFLDPVFGTVSDSVASWKLFGGFEVNDYLALEVSYGVDDSIEQSGSATILPFGDITAQLDIDLKKTSFKAVGRLPFDSFVLLGGLGYFSASGDFAEYAVIECCGTETAAGSFEDDGMMAQFGVEWRFGRFGTSYGIRLEYEWWDLSGVDSSTLGLAFTYGF